jgi:DNA polymerase III delta prime subunit
LGLDYQEELDLYAETVAGGRGAVPFVLHVSEQRPPDERLPGRPWAMVAVEDQQLPHPLTTQEFLKLRATPLTLARQFKAMAAPGRHIQEIPTGTTDAIVEAGSRPPALREELLRRFSLVKASTAEEASAKLAAAGRPATPGDRAVLVAPDRIAGVHVATEDGLVADGEQVNLPPAALRELFVQAALRGANSFRPYNPMTAASALADFMASDDDVRDIEQFSYYHDLYVRLPRNVNQALRLGKLPVPPGGGASPSAPRDADREEEDAIVDDLESLIGLTAEAVRNELPAFALPQAVFDEAVTALRSGKHLLLSGPPGTGKSTVATAICRAVVDEQFDVATATADWTTFDTIGGYLPRADGTLRFEPGIVLRALERSHWLVIDELNRADIDKAFGPLFTLLAGTGAEAPPAVVLPYRDKEGKSIRVNWSESASADGGPYALTPSWRLIGTLNRSDKASLFQLSFAFLRRFAIIDIPLPSRADYAALFDVAIADVDAEARAVLTEAAMALAFGPRPLGPAILIDIARFVSTGTAPTQAGAPPFADPVDAFLTAVRLYAVPQYEGADRGEIDRALRSMQAIWPDRDGSAWKPLRDALAAVELA